MNPTLGSLRYHDGDGGDKRYLKSDFAFFETSVRLYRPAYFVKRSRNLLELNSAKTIHDQKEDKSFLAYLRPP